jgi:hypothetical protein
VTLRTLFVVFWACLIGTAAVAGDEQRTEIKIAVDSEDSGHRVFRFDSQESDVDLHALAVGESEVITDSDGNEVTVLRTENGFEFDVAGEKIEIDGMHGEHNVEDIVVEKHKQVRVIKSNNANGVTIISGDEIDATTRAALEKVLKDAGNDGEVLFLDGSELSGDERAHGRHEVRIIKKEIDATN